jgi:hypothetical protein
MSKSYITLLSGLLGAGILISCTTSVFPQENASAGSAPGNFDQATLAQGNDTAPQTGVQPQGRGPVHEAFAAPATGVSAPGPIAPRKPPEPLEEMPAAEKPEGDDVQWIPGYYAWDDEAKNFIWVTGIWRVPPPGRQWVPGHWTQVQGGYQFTSGFWAPTGQGEIKLVSAPPAAPAESELPPDEPAPSASGNGKPVNGTPVAGTTGTTTATSADSVFVPGNYVYQESGYVWRPGYHIVNRPGWVWVPASYIYTPCGYIYVEGYWDYVVQDRGLLFAPVIVDVQIAAQPGWYYTPTYVVHDQCFLEALFIRSNCGCYFFGDYYDVGYERLGYVSWFDYRFSRFGYDPLFSYYRWSHRGEPRWEREQRGLFVARRKGDLVRPARTLALQQALIQNLKAGKVAGGANVQRSLLLASLDRVDRKVVRLKTLDKAQLTQQRSTADQFRALSRQREQVQTRLIAQGVNANKKGAGVQTLSLNLPKTGLVTNTTGKGVPPLPATVKRITEHTTITGTDNGSKNNGKGGSVDTTRTLTPGPGNGAKINNGPAGDGGKGNVPGGTTKIINNVGPTGTQSLPTNGPGGTKRIETPPSPPAPKILKGTEGQVFNSTLPGNGQVNVGGAPRIVRTLPGGGNDAVGRISPFGGNGRNFSPAPVNRSFTLPQGGGGGGRRR